jgi:single-strand DNA-binding protein
MASYNRIIMMGNLTRDPEYKQLASGHGLCRLSLASNRQFKNRQGEMSEEVCFVDIDVWGAQADNCNQYLQKGRPVLIEGRLKFDTWEDNEGRRRTKHSITADRVTFLGSGISTNDDSSRDDKVRSFSSNSSTKDNKIQSFSENPSSDELKAAVKAAENTDLTSNKEAVDVQKKLDKKTKKASPSGEIDFKNEKPFEDNLPF